MADEKSQISISMQTIENNGVRINVDKKEKISADGTSQLHTKSLEVYPNGNIVYDSSLGNHKEKPEKATALDYISGDAKLSPPPSCEHTERFNDPELAKKLLEIADKYRAEQTTNPDLKNTTDGLKSIVSDLATTVNKVSQKSGGRHCP